VPDLFPGNIGYHRELEWKGEPSREELLWADQWIDFSGAEQAPSPSVTLATIGPRRLILVPAGPRGATRGTAELLLCRKQSVPVGVDARVNDHKAPSFPHGGDLRFARPAITPPSEEGIRVAVIDTDFDGIERLAGKGVPADRQPFLVGLRAEGAPRPERDANRLGHGTAVAGAVLHQAPQCIAGCFEIPRLANGSARPYLAAADIAVALCEAVGSWGADLVLIPVSDGCWGSPRYLRAVLRAAAVEGRGGRGVAIFSSVGDPSKNRSRLFPSAALGADDLASQPFVNAVAACDHLKTWYRTYDVLDHNGTAYNRLGPAVAFAASGERLVVDSAIALDDSSAATALAGVAATRVLRIHPQLSAFEVRELLKVTAEVPRVVDDESGLAARDFNDWDRDGHNFKLGHGCIHREWAQMAAGDPLCLAFLMARERPDPPRASTSRGARLARAWHDFAAGAEKLAQYRRARPALVRQVLRSPAVRESFLWLARHLLALHRTKDPGWPAQDHGALADRVRLAIELAAEAGADDGAREIAELRRRLETDELEQQLGAAIQRIFGAA
jgi:hypothetical protein